MEVNQIELLTLLAEKIRTEKKDRAKIVATLKSAKILTSTKSENFTKHYPNLKKAAVVVK